MRNILLHATAVVFCAFSGPAAAQEPISTPILSSASNFRDLAGIATRHGGTGQANTTSHGGVMRTEVFYRTNALNTLDYADWTRLSSLNIRHDIDWRTPSEISAARDWVPNGATYTNINIYGTVDPPPTDLITTEAQAISYMRGTYEGFVADSTQRANLRQGLLFLANTSDPALYHCSGGKDRTGWVSAVLQEIAGVSSATILQDYLATNSYSATEIQQTKDALEAAGQGYLIPITDVREEYLQAGLDQVLASYASMDAYLTHGLGLSQADVYVLRAKMVYYPTLPGQSGLVGNAAAGATLLNQLQNSPLSGHYTDFNYYLQSAVDAGTLGGIETQVGGQVFADATSYLFRQPVWLDWAVAPNANSRDLEIGQRRLWLVGLGGYFESDDRAGVARSTEGSGGSLVGATYRMGERFSVDAGVGYTGGSIESAGASAQVDTVPFTLGGRFGFFTLDAGPYVAARADLGWANYRSTRVLGGGLGIARGDTTGAMYSGRFDLGNVIRLASLTITPQAGVRVTQATFGRFSESGSELALDVQGTCRTASSVLADLEVSLNPRPWGSWIVAPSVDFGYELVLGNSQFESTGGLYGFTVNQSSAYDSPYLMKLGFAVTAQRGALNVTAAVQALHGDGASTGIVPQLSIGYGF